jgi:hypothetical protein
MKNHCKNKSCSGSFFAFIELNRAMSALAFVNAIDQAYSGFQEHPTGGGASWNAATLANFWLVWSN